MITRKLKVLLWGKEIGRLSWDDRRGLSYFEYSKEALQGQIDAFPIVASVKSPTSHRPIWGEKEVKLYRKLPPFLADSLPDAWGNQVFECWRIEQGISHQEITPLDLLSYIGRRGMGALEFVPESSGIRQAEQLNLKALTELAQRIFAERENACIRPDESLTMQSLIAVGTSAGGRQPKAIIAINPETKEIRSGQIAGHEGFEYCILKFGDPERSSAELEMAYYQMAQAAGIEMMPCRLIESDGRRHFVTLRFDRYKEKKVHMQTLAALYPEADSYESLLMVCRKMRLPESTQEEVFRRLVFNILANNTDDHNKNFSFLMDETGRWRLSPAYDMTYIFNVGGYLPEQNHCLMLRGKTSGFTLEDVLQMAKENGIRRAQSIIADVVNAIGQFRRFAKSQQVQERWIGAIESCLNQHLKDWGLSPNQTSLTLTIDGQVFSNVHIEQVYRGNFHLLAEENGRVLKFVIGRNKDEYPLIAESGIDNLSETQYRELIEKYLIKKCKS